MEALHVYDTTLRDGAQQEGLNLSVSDKLAIAGLLDDLAVDFIEGARYGRVIESCSTPARRSCVWSRSLTFATSRKPCEPRSMRTWPWCTTP